MSGRELGGGAFLLRLDLIEANLLIGKPGVGGPELDIDAGDQCLELRYPLLGRRELTADEVLLGLDLGEPSLVGCDLALEIVDRIGARADRRGGEEKHGHRGRYKRTEPDRSHHVH